MSRSCVNPNSRPEIYTAENGDAQPTQRCQGRVLIADKSSMCGPSHPFTITFSSTKRTALSVQGPSSFARMALTLLGPGLTLSSSRLSTDFFWPLADRHSMLPLVFRNLSSWLQVWAASPTCETIPASVHWQLSDYTTTNNFWVSFSLHLLRHLLSPKQALKLQPHFR